MTTMRDADRRPTPHVVEPQAPATEMLPTQRRSQPVEAVEAVEAPTAVVPAQPGPAAQAPSTGAGSTRSGGRGRDRYIDSLRALALVRVVTYHLFGWVWLPILFPSMGIMFALAGSLMAASIDREQRHYAHVLAKRLRRLLPPLWAMGLVLVPLMLWWGWTVTGDTGSPLQWDTMLLWLVPLATPPGSAGGEDLVVPLWYISTYLWLMVLSPATLWLFRRWPKRMLVLPILFVALNTAGVIELSDRTGDMMLYVATYMGCWMLGFAHHDGLLRRIPLGRVVLLSLGLAAFGLYYAFAHPDPESGPNVSDIPMATTFYSLGVVLLLLRLYLDFSWMKKLPLLDGLVAAMNRRAMTIYLWGNTAIALALWGLSQSPYTEPFTEDTANPWVAGLVSFAAVWVVVGAIVLGLGWVEDVAARRRPTLLPRAAKPGRRRAHHTAKTRVPQSGYVRRWTPEGAERA